MKYRITARNNADVKPLLADLQRRFRGGVEFKHNGGKIVIASNFRVASVVADLEEFLNDTDRCSGYHDTGDAE